MTDPYPDEQYSPVKTHYALIVATGDHLAARETITSDILKTLNPFYTDEGDSAYYEDRAAPRVSGLQIAYAVEYLLALVAEARGQEEADALRRELDFRVDKYPEGDVYITGLDQDRWLHIADLVLIRALEMSHRGVRPAEEWLSASEVEAQYGLGEGTVRKAIRTRFFPAEKRGRDWMVKRSDADREWGNKR